MFCYFFLHNIKGLETLGSDQESPVSEFSLTDNLCSPFSLSLKTFNCNASVKCYYRYVGDFELIMKYQQFQVFY